jgi:TRAP-type C4-dicarboxylate transport system permease small subunit
LIEKVAQTLDRILERVCYAFVYISGVMALLMACLATYGVIRRYAFNDPEKYSYEISIMFLLVGVVLALPYIQRVERNIRVDFIVNRLPAGVQAVLGYIVFPLLALFYIVPLTWKSWENSWYALQVGERSYSSWAPLVGPIKVMVPICAALLSLVLIAQLCRGVYSLVESSRKKKEAGTVA